MYETTSFVHGHIACGASFRCRICSVGKLILALDVFDLRGCDSDGIKGEFDEVFDRIESAQVVFERYGHGKAPRS